MKVFAPGKLVLTGAYAVLEGAPAISLAVSRGALVDPARTAPNATPEVAAALGEGTPAPHADASAMFVGTRKLGLGASAAILVATLAATEDGDLATDAVRARILARAKAAHAKAQSGGSGVDVATSVYGGAIRYRIDAPVVQVRLPSELVVSVLACGTSARTTELRARIDALASTSDAIHRQCMNDLVAIANEAASAVDGGSAEGLVEALRRTARALDRLGVAAGVPIVPPGFEELEGIAAADRASFTVSGAGGGDVAIHLGPREPSARFLERAHAHGLFALPLTLDATGVRRATLDSRNFSHPGTIEGQP